MLNRRVLGGSDSMWCIAEEEIKQSTIKLTSTAGVATIGLTLLDPRPFDALRGEHCYESVKGISNTRSLARFLCCRACWNMARPSLTGCPSCVKKTV